MFTDNLAAHFVEGYMSFSSVFRKCWICLAVREDMNNKFFATDFVEHDRQTHAYHCSLLLRSNYTYVATTYGFTEDSILNSSKYFHVTEGLCPDVMQDMLEDSLHKKKPTPISSNILTSSDHSLKQTASQIWCWARIVPLIIHDLVPMNESHWDNFLLLLTATDYVFAPTLANRKASYLHHVRATNTLLVYEV
uniref:Uncharacterized protein n=1 Tax=Amphimedon queenslandica TaxID=400682 RepID=A0A1X7UTH9_AMPQE